VLTRPATRRAKGTAVPSPLAVSTLIWLSAEQAIGLVRDWFTGNFLGESWFGPANSLTQDIMYDPGMTAFRNEWAAAGYPLPWTYNHTIDERDAGRLLTRIWNGLRAYGAENKELYDTLGGHGSTTPSGPIDAVGGIVGSLDKITVSDAGGRSVLIVVRNTVNCECGLRMYGTHVSVGRLIPASWPGGVGYVQNLWWYETKPQSIPGEPEP
jgi:hypothetical protein